jgi:predicted metal-dependent HD superfamily phosphohydrolase
MASNSRVGLPDPINVSLEIMTIRKLKEFICDKLKKELSSKLSYHGLHHTLNVLEVCNRYIRRLQLSPKDAYLLRTAAIMHDVGILWTYNGHEEAAVQYAWKLLPGYGYTKSDIQKIEGMILATKIPQKPRTQLEKILCDADLDYLGTDSFYPIGNTLKKEFISYGIIKNKEEWNQLQINFLSGHAYHTTYAKKYREGKKRKFLEELNIKEKK